MSTQIGLIKTPTGYNRILMVQDEDGRVANTRERITFVQYYLLQFKRWRQDRHFHKALKK